MLPHPVPRPVELRANGAAWLPGGVVDTLQQFAAAGAETTSLQVLDLDGLDHFRLLASDVLPAVSDS